ncbi:uncharacterized protein TNCV_276161 [Trichonephila clavipes]|nr:uncharacterized protein TNCV_276161 [Trichonephila clavipes]
MRCQRRDRSSIHEPMHFDFTMMREMSNRTRFDSGQGGASVETGHKSMNLTTLRGHALESQNQPATLRKGERGQRMSPMCRIESQSKALPSPQCPPLTRDFLGGPTRKKKLAESPNWLRAVSLPSLKHKKDKLKTIFLSLTLFPILDSQAEKMSKQ